MKTNASTPQRYTVCLYCNAKMFSAVELANCPRCGAVVRGSTSIATPWSSHRVQQVKCVQEDAATETDDRTLLRTIAFALRHDPRRFFLEIDSNGSIDVEQLVLALRYQRREWADLSVDDLRRMADSATTERFEIVGNRIRALYGHSIVNLNQLVSEEPPTYLFHGTAEHTVREILEVGLRPMGRTNVHLSLDWRYANSVAQAKSDCPTVLVVRALAAHQTSIKFRRSNDHVWLSEAIPPEFIRTPE